MNPDVLNISYETVRHCIYSICYLFHITYLEPRTCSRSMVSTCYTPHVYLHCFRISQPCLTRFLIWHCVHGFRSSWAEMSISQPIFADIDIVSARPKFGCKRTSFGLKGKNMKHVWSAYHWWVVYLLLWKILLRQLGWWHSQNIWRKIKHVPNHQPV